MADPRNFQDYMTKQLQQKQLQQKLENIFTSSRVPGTYLRNPEPSRAGKLTDMLTSGLESLGIGGQTAYNVGNTVQSLTPAKSLDDLDKGDPTSALESIAGGPAQAMFVGPMARGIDKLALKEARGLARAGTRPSDILNDTGWFRGRDEKWRTEIDDSMSRIHGSKASGMEGDPINRVGFSPDPRNPDMMSDVFTHDKLYEAYPELAGYGVNELDPKLAAQGYGGSFGKTPRKLAMSVDGGLPSHFVSMASGAFGAAPGHGPRRTMLHELQHAVQGIEGFEPGSNPDWVAQQAKVGNISMEAVRPFWDRAVQEGYDPKTAMSKAFHDIYQRNAGEAEAELTSSRADFRMPTRKRLSPLDELNVDIPFEEQWMWNRDINDMLKGGRGISSKTVAGWAPKTSASKKTPWEEMYHGTMKPFNEPLGGDITDLGLHLSDDPSVASTYAGGVNFHGDAPELKTGASRIYPLLVDPGKKFEGHKKGLLDPKDWTDPVEVANAMKVEHATPSGKFSFKSSEPISLKDWKWRPDADKTIQRITDDLYSGAGVKEAFGRRGYDSITYQHPDLWGLDDEKMLKGLNLFDSSRAIPKFSTEGLSIASGPGYKPAKKKLSTPDDGVWEHLQNLLGL